MYIHVIRNETVKAKLTARAAVVLVVAKHSRNTKIFCTNI